MSVSPEQVRRIAALAALEPGDDEVDRVAGELSDILAHFERLRGAVGGEPLTAEGAERAEGTAVGGAEAAEAAEPAEPGRRARLRPDEPGTDRLEADPAAMAPGWRGGFFTVPRLASHETAAADPAGAGEPGESGESGESPEPGEGRG